MHEKGDPVTKLWLICSQTLFSWRQVGTRAHALSLSIITNWFTTKGKSLREQQKVFSQWRVIVVAKYFHFRRWKTILSLLDRIRARRLCLCTFQQWDEIVQSASADRALSPPPPPRSESHGSKQLLVLARKIYNRRMKDAWISWVYFIFREKQLVQDTSSRVT
jgi:hypothetical protein